MTLKDVFIALLVIMIWGVNFWFMKIALGDVPPLVLGLLRFLCVLMPAIFFIKKPSTSWKLLIAYGLTISFGQFSFVFLALSLGFATGLAALILQTQVFLTVIFASIYFKESIKIHQLWSMLIAFIGLFLIGVGHYQGHLSFWAMLPVLVAAMSWSCGNIIVKKIGQVNGLSLVVWGNVSSFVAFSLASFAFYGVSGTWSYVSNLSGWGVVAVLFLAYVSSLVGYSGWGTLLSRYHASKVTPFALGVPVIALLLGFILLDEYLKTWHIAGIITVMTGLIVHIFYQRK